MRRVLCGAWQAVEWSYASDTCRSPDKGTTCTIVARHHFNSNLKRMSCVVRCSTAYTTRYELVAKGAPEIIKQFLGACVSLHAPACVLGFERSFGHLGGA